MIDPSWNCEKVIAILQRKGINFVAVDFDLTLVAKHTGGERGDSRELVKLVRPCFSKFIPCLLDSNISVAVVTFSSQTDLVKETVKLGFPLHWNKIVVRASDKSWGDMGDSAMFGKQKYIASAAEELEKIFGFEITRDSALLIDDDQNNIRIALRNHVRALLFIPHNPNSVFSDIIELGSI
jgi:hypothetical protein